MEDETKSSLHSLVHIIFLFPGELQNVGSGEFTNYGEQVENVNELYPALL